MVVVRIVAWLEKHVTFCTSAYMLYGDQVVYW